MAIMMTVTVATFSGFQTAKVNLTTGAVMPQLENTVFELLMQADERNGAWRATVGGLVVYEGTVTDDRDIRPIDGARTFNVFTTVAVTE